MVLLIEESLVNEEKKFVQELANLNLNLEKRPCTGDGKPRVDWQIRDGHIIKLEIIDWKQFNEIPESIGELSHLEYLNLGEDPFSELPQSMANLKELQEIHLWWNWNLRRMPEWIDQWHNLRKIVVNNCGVENVPRSIGNMIRLKNLSVLHLNNNQIELLPEWIGCLISLTDLDIQMNQISDIPDSFLKLSHLQFLRTSNNPWNQTWMPLLGKSGFGNFRDHDLIQKIRLILADRQLKNQIIDIPNDEKTKASLKAKFVKILSICEEITIQRAARSLGISENTLFELLLDWHDLGFKVKDNKIVKDLPKN